MMAYDRMVVPSAATGSQYPSGAERAAWRSAGLREMYLPRLTRSGLQEMRAGVALHASDDGEVIATRDGIPDIDLRLLPEEIIRLAPEGNLVDVHYISGALMRYQHLREHSVAVRPGDMVCRGDLLGMAGMSGAVSTPAIGYVLLNAASLASDRQPVHSGPFDPLATVPLVIDAGLRTGHGKGPLVQMNRILSGADALCFMVHVARLAEGDCEHFRLHDADGQPLLYESRLIDSPLKTDTPFITSASIARPVTGWPQGRVRALWQLERDGAVIAAVARTSCISA